MISMCRKTSNGSFKCANYGYKLKILFVIPTSREKHVSGASLSHIPN